VLGFILPPPPDHEHDRGAVRAGMIQGFYVASPRASCLVTTGHEAENSGVEAAWA
jgi:hypothetical protein